MEDHRVVITYCELESVGGQNFMRTCDEIKTKGECPDEKCLGRIE